MQSLNQFIFGLNHAVTISFVLHILNRSKLAMGLLSGQYSQQPLEELSPVPKEEGGKDNGGQLQKEQKGIRPQMFKTLIGTGHREFSSNRQQVASVYNSNTGVFAILIFSFIFASD